jgi:hypothetical protein
VASSKLDTMTKRMVNLIDSVVGSTARTVRAVVLILAIAVATGQGAYTSTGLVACSLRHTGNAMTDTASGHQLAGARIATGSR